MKISPAARLAIGLSGLTVTILCAVHTIGLIPDTEPLKLKERGRLCETIAVNVSWLAAREDTDGIRATLTLLVDRYPDLLSARVRQQDGNTVVEVGDHAQHWQPEVSRDGGANVFVPIVAGTKEWGTVELAFEPMRPPGLLGMFYSPVIVFVSLVAALSLVVTYMYLRKMLRSMDPTSVVPDRVRQTLDTIADGLLVTDNKDTIILANKAFGTMIGVNPDSLVGQNATSLPWRSVENAATTVDRLPWRIALNQGQVKTGLTIGLTASETDFKSLMVNSSPILGDDGKHRGALSSFDDITQLVRRKRQLAQMLVTVKKASEEVESQNRVLEQLASHDPLTGCVNRRSFFDHFESQWKYTQRHDTPLSCIMVDVDHFKQINDQHGHAIGDEVLKQVALILRETARDGDIVARYGGEEFCILLPHASLDDAMIAAERFRLKIERTKTANVKVTVSLGVSNRMLGASDPQSLIDEADKCLYFAKQSGRNCIARWDEVPKNFTFRSSDKLALTSAPAEERVPFRAVSALISALAYRDPATAAHSRRVADLCVRAAEGLMSVIDCYTLEIAALLHDIGKIGVPDHILLKTGPLTRDEWQVMRQHERIGIEIVRTSFGSPALTQIVEQYRIQYEQAGSTDQERQRQVSVGARILTIADAYDAMTTDQSYRAGRSMKQAFEELRRCAGQQFDPELVERFIHSVELFSRQDQRKQTGNVTKEAALAVGLQIEQLAHALDEQDISGLQSLASRLSDLAAHSGIPELAEQSAQLEKLVEADADLFAVLQSANELLGLCRSTQKVLSAT